MAKSKIAVLYTKPETVLDDYRRLFELAGADKALDPGATTILKDNISWHFPMPAANTTPWQLEGTILALKALGLDDQVCVQNETVVINAFKGEDLNLFRPIFDAYNIPVLYNFREEEIKWIPYEPKGEMLELDRIMEGVGIHIPEYFLGKNIVHLPTFKCHIYTTTTGAMKNAFGGLLNTRRHYTHTWIHQTLVDLLTIQKEIHSGIFCAMDGTTAGNGEGPRTHIPEVKNVILAGADQVACDAVSAKMMGFDPLSIDYIRLAHEKGLGIGDPAEIEIVGDDVAGENWHFKVGYNFHRFLAWLGWYGPTKFLQKLVFRTCIVKIPIFVSEFNHDYVQWPLKFEKLYKKWRAETPWGQLFDRYEREKALGKP
jgi:uncharacterized protein (DUF362 family)